MARLCASARCDRPGCTDRHPYHNTDGKIYRSIRPQMGQLGLLSDEMDAGVTLIPLQTPGTDKNGMYYSEPGSTTRHYV